MNLIFLPLINIIICGIVFYQTSSCVLKYFKKDKLLFIIYNPMPIVCIALIILHSKEVCNLYIYDDTSKSFVAWQIALLFSFLFIYRLVFTISRYEKETEEKEKGSQ